MEREPASIRYKNPGAMWGSALAKKWGALKAVKLNDGLGQGNNIAEFPTYVQGICAQLDLWRSSPRYKDKRFSDAIATWSGGNNVPSYISFCKQRVPGLTESTVMNDAFWRGPMGIPFLKAQAWHEAGKQYPAPDADWITARGRVFSDGRVSSPKLSEVPPPKPLMKSTIAKGTVATGVVTAVGTGAQVAQMIQTTTDTISNTSDNVVTVVQTVHPLFGFISHEMLIGLAVGCAIVSVLGCGFVLWKRFRKLQDEGV